MGKLASISPAEFEKFLLFIGCIFIRQKGSHRVYRRDDLKRPIIVPFHSGDLPMFVVRNNLRVLNISPEAYLDILSRM
jgi:predicted RNA binding protein YcfA (HicA-like mRNA interferase family)